MLKQRDIQIISILYGQLRPIESAEMEKKLGIAGRTLRKAILELKSELAKRGAVIQHKINQGYILDIFNAPLFSQFWEKVENQNQAKYADSAMRLRYMLIWIFIYHGIVNEKRLKEVFNLNQETFNLDMLAIEKRLNTSNFTFVREGGILRVWGSHLQIEQFLSDVRYKEIPEIEYVEIFKILGIQKEVYMEKQKIVESALYQTIIKHDLMLSEVAFENICFQLHLNITLEDKFESEPNHYDIDECQSEYAIVQETLLKISEKFEINISEAEILSIANQLHGKRFFTERTMDQISYEDIRVVEVILSHAFKRIAEYFRIDLTQDEDLKNSLKLHLLSTLQRSKLNLYLRNPMTEELKSEFPLFYHFSSIFSMIFEEETGKVLTEDEIAYIAVHISLSIDRRIQSKRRKAMMVYDLGMATRRINEYRLNHVFGEYFEITDSIPSLRLKEKDPRDFDLIISTVKNIDLPTEKTIFVSDLVNEEEIQNIRQFCENTLLKKIKTDYHVATYHCQQKHERKTSAIHEIGEHWESTGLFNYYRLFNRYQPMMVSHRVMIAFADSDDVFITHNILQNELQYRGQQIDRIIIYSLGKDGDCDYRKLNRFLSEFIMMPIQP